MKRNIVLAIVSTIVTLLVTVGLLRWLAPGLLGIAPDLQLVRVAKEAQPFFEVVFGDGEPTETEFLLRDPFVVNRGRPFYPDQLGYGLHDVLGFRNRSVPATADVVTIGDSQTYGNNAPIDLNWPSQLAAQLGDLNAVVYNMSVGGWEAPQYLYILEKALQLRPQVVVVAFYSGNDPIGSFMQAYGAEHWADLRPDPSLSKSDTPPSRWPPKPEDMWHAQFADGSSTVFTPDTRLTSNLPDHPAVDAGWKIMAEVARRIDAAVGEAGIRAVFTVIPTKELTYALRVEAETLQAPGTYRALVNQEAKNIALLATTIGELPRSAYVDVVRALQGAAATTMLYPSDGNGHPIPSGYGVIADVVEQGVLRALPSPPEGFLFLKTGSSVLPMLARDGLVWIFDSMERAGQNGWRFEDAKWVSERDIATLRRAGFITKADPVRFGPD